MSIPDPTPYISDSLSSASRRERKNLLVASAFSLLFSLAGLVPKELSFLGITLTEPDQKHLIYIMASVILYFFLAFIFYCIPDAFIWMKHQHDYDRARHSEPDDWDQNKNESIADHQYEPTPIFLLFSRMIRFVARARVVFDFLIPLLIGIFSILMLICRGSYL